MSKSVINFYLEKVSQGDRSFMEALCVQLAERLVYVPVLDVTADASGVSTTVDVVQFREGERHIIPAFTSEKRFQEWKSKAAHQGGSISLLGADLCAALGSGSWVSIDPGNPASVELPPAVVEKIAKTGIDGEGTIQSPPGPAKAEPAGPGQAPALEEKSRQGQPVGPKVMVQEEDVAVSTVNRRIIFSSSAIVRPELPAKAPQVKAKRSFLSFLKSAK